jgi:multiple sugar transport system permease protein
MSMMSRYISLQRRKLETARYKARQMWVCYLFLLPFALLFFTFYILPIITSIRYSFRAPLKTSNFL